MTDQHLDEDRMRRLAKRSAIVGAATMTICFIMWFIDRSGVLQAYLLAFLTWLSVPLGCWALLMLHHLVSGHWGFAIRRILEAATRTFPAMAVLFLPLLTGPPDLYPWAREDARADSLLAHREVYLNDGFFIGRAAFYFGVWIIVSFYLNRWSKRQDETGEPTLVRRLQHLSGGGLVLFGITSSFCAIDWLMSIESQFYSTIFGAVFFAGAGISALTFAIILLTQMRTLPQLEPIATTRSFHDLGKLLLAFLMLWAYMAFAQYLITWAGNLPDRIPWFVDRVHHGWEYVGLMIIIFHFGLPFFLLLSKRSKRQPIMLCSIASLLFFVRYIHFWWEISPKFSPKGVRFSLLNLATVVAVGGLWFAYFLWQLTRRTLEPNRDPRLEAMIGEGAVQHG